MSFGGSFTVETWLRPGVAQALGARLADFGNPELSGVANADALVFAFCPSGYPAECSVPAGKMALIVKVYHGSRLASRFVFFEGAVGIPVGTIGHVAIVFSAAVNGSSSVKGYLNGELVSSATSAPVPVATRARSFLGSANEWGVPRATSLFLARFRIWGANRSADEISAIFYEKGALPADKPLLYLKLDDCGSTGVQIANDSSTFGLDAEVVGDVALRTCSDVPARPSTPTLAAAAADPSTVTAAVRFTAGQGVQSVSVLCTGLGGPYAALSAANDSDAAAGLALTLAVGVSYGGDYNLACTANVRSDTAYSDASAVLSVTVPEATTAAGQSGVVPAGNPATYNEHLRVGALVASHEEAAIVFSAPLAAYPIGRRPPSHRFALLLRLATTGLWYCDWDLDAGVCSVLEHLSSVAGFGAPVDFSATSLSPWPPCDPDFRPASLAGIDPFAACWPWSDAAFASRVAVVGPAVAGVLQPPAACASAACQTYAAQRWSLSAFSGCEPGPLGPARPWSASSCQNASPYDFMAPARNFSHDFRLQRAAYERRMYEALAGIAAGADTEATAWLGLLGTIHLYAPAVRPALASGALLLGSSSLGLGCAVPHAPQPDLLAGGGSGGQAPLASALFAQDLPPATGCVAFVDVEASAAKRTAEAKATLAELQRAYNASYGGLVLQDSRHFAAWGRGIAHFASWASLESPAACSLPHGVALLALDFSALAPAGFSADAGGAYVRFPFLTEPAAAFADLYPPSASVQHFAADGRVAAGGRLLYRALVRVPFFPVGSTASCKVRLVGDIVCPQAAIAHVTAVLTWEVDPASFADVTASAPLPAYRTGATLHGPPLVIRTDLLPLSEHWIVQNERPLVAGPGFGFLEGRWVDPTNSRFAFYVMGDMLYRFAKADAYQSGLAGALNGSARIYGGGNWNASRAEWTSVAAAVYKDGSLFVVREVHTPANTRAFGFATDSGPRPRLEKAHRLKRRNERAHASQLLRLTRLDGADFRPDLAVLLDPFPATVIAAHVAEDFAGGAMFGFGAGVNASLAELPLVVFVVSSPPMLVRMRTDCPPGTRWNWEAALVNNSVPLADLCRPLAPGLYSTRGGLLFDADGTPCPTGTYPAGGALSCQDCPAGTYSDAGAAVCYDCPMYTFSKGRRQPCTPCDASGYTTGPRWPTDCFFCPSGNELVMRKLYEQSVACAAPRAAPHALPAGTAGYIVSGAMTGCEPCPAGTYYEPEVLKVVDGSSLFTAPRCKRCPVGQFSGIAALNCTLCPSSTTTTAKRDGCPVNWVASAPGSSTCVPCRAGTFSTTDFQSCIPCPTGTYRDDAMGACETVPGGCVASAGAANYTVCPPGSVPNGATTFCVACPKGTRANVTSCERCAVNHIAADVGSAACTPCALGWVASADQQKCIRCHAGTYRNGSMSVCEPVPPNAVSAAAAANYTECAPGTVVNGEHSSCMPCPKGSYEEAGSCTTCPNNTVTSVEGQTACAVCLTGQISRPDQQDCVTCLAGWYRPEDSLYCQAVPARSISVAGLLFSCAAGTVPNGPRSECLSCPPGSYQAEDACVPCAANEAAPLPALTNCTACGEGRVSTADLQKCILCEGGFYRHEPLEECTRVPLGAVAMPGSANYTVCERGSVPNPESTSCQKCEKGTYETDFVCKRCAGINSYAPDAGMTACLECPAGTVARADGQGCGLCPRGYFRASDMETCTPCAHGFVTVAAGAAVCEACANGTEATLDRTECRLCRAGRHDRNKTCIAPEGKVPREDRANCKNCEAGSVPVSGVCARCTGNAISAPGDEKCAPCPAGSVANEGRSQCDVCPAGTFVPLHATAPTCERCPLNAVSPAGASGCSVCDVGAVSDEGQSFCADCAPGTFRNATLEHCHPCDTGTYAPAAKATSCLGCSPTQLRVLGLEPFARVWRRSPQGMDALAAEGLASLVNETALPARRRLFRLRLGTARRLLAAAASAGGAEPLADEGGVEVAEESVVYDRTNATVRRAVVKTQEAATRRLSRLVNWTAVGVVLGVASVLTGGVAYIWRPRRGRKRPPPEVKQRREERLAKFHLLYLAKVHEALEKARIKRERLAARLGAAPDDASVTPTPRTEFEEDEVEPVLADSTTDELSAASALTTMPRSRVNVLVADPTTRLASLTIEALDAAAAMEPGLLFEWYVDGALVLDEEGPSLSLSLAIGDHCVVAIAIDVDEDESLFGESEYDPTSDPILLRVVEKRPARRRAPREARPETAASCRSLAPILMREGLEDGVEHSNLDEEEEDVYGITRPNWIEIRPQVASAAGNCNWVGAGFTSVGLGLIIIAGCSVLLQYYIANYQVLQSLVIGSSPSIGAVAGAWRVSAAFVGFRGDCAEAANATSVTAMDAGLHFSVAGIVPIEGTLAPSLTASYIAAQRSCLCAVPARRLLSWRRPAASVAWSCERCSMAANEAYVEFHLVSRLAFAVAVNFALRAPHYASIVGTVRTSQDGLFTVFRGSSPVLVPVLLTPVHFDDARDGAPRFEVALQPASNRAAERNEASFSLCSPTKPLEACPGEAVGFRARFDLNPVYLAVSRKTRATFVDMLSDLAALSKAAMKAGAKLILASFVASQIAWVISQYVSRRRSRRTAVLDGKCQPPEHHGVSGDDGGGGAGVAPKESRLGWAAALRSEVTPIVSASDITVRSRARAWRTTSTLPNDPAALPGRGLPTCTARPSTPRRASALLWSAPTPNEEGIDIIELAEDELAAVPTTMA
eukprot:tig00000361_g24397.t1